MKSLFKIFFVALLVLSAFTACKKNQGHDENVMVFEFSNQDSLDIKTLADTYINYFNSKDFESCADNLFTVRNDSIFPLTDDERNQFVSSMKTIPSFGCELMDLALKTDRDNKVRISIYLSEADSLNQGADRPSVNFVLNPVKVEGKWYLTLYDPHAEGVGIY